VNERVFNIMQSVWQAGGGIAGVPARANAPVPILSLLHTRDDSGAFNRERYDALKQLKLVMKNNAELHSLRTDFLYKLETARVFLGHEFYFPHNVDFRGRAYPMPIHLHHLGSDACRCVCVRACVRVRVRVRLCVQPRVQGLAQVLREKARGRARPLLAQSSPCKPLWQEQDELRRAGAVDGDAQGKRVGCSG